MKDSPYLQAMSTSGMAGALDTLFTELPEARNAFVSNDHVRIDGGSMSKRAQGALLQCFKDIDKMQLLHFPGESQKDSPPQAGQMALIVNREVLDTRHSFFTGPSRRFKLGAISIACPKLSGSDQGSLTCTVADLDIADPNSSLGQLIGCSIVELEEGYESKTSVHPFSITLRPEEMPLMVGEGEPQVAHDDDPAIRIDVDCKAEDVKLPGGRAIKALDADGYMATIARSSGFSVISDCLTQQARMGSSFGKTPLPSVLSTLSNPTFNYNWWRHGSCLELRDRNWYKKVSLMIPEAWLVKWRSTLVKTGTLTIDDMADVATIAGDDERFSASIETDEVLMASDIAMIRPGVPFLRFWATLDAKQRNAVFTQDGLDMQDLSEEQWMAFERILPCARGTLVNPILTGTGKMVDPVELGTSQASTHKSAYYSFIISGGASARFDISGPNYRDPTKPQPPSGVDLKINANEFGGAGVVMQSPE